MAGTSPGPVGRVVLRAIHLYQVVRDGRPSPCRFFPSCSCYAEEAVREHGTLRGGILALRRLGRCRPFGPSGFDPVPPAVRPSSRRMTTGV